MDHQPELRGKNIRIGDNCRFGTNVVIHENVSIGNNCQIEDGCVIGHPFEGSEKETVISDGSLIRSHTIIYTGAQLGKACTTGHHACIRENSIIGTGCSIGSYSDLQGDLTIGDYCRLHSDVHLCKGSKLDSFVFLYPRVTLTNDPYPPSMEVQGPHIKSYSQICTGTIVLPNITIGKNCLVGAASLVTRDIAEHSLAFGHPADVWDDVSTLSKKGKPRYPWMYRYSKNMPWEGIGFDKWRKEQQE